MTTGDVVRIDDAAAWSFALEGRLDPEAPVSASGSILIDRPAEVVWTLLRAVTNWPDIRADVHDVVVEDGAGSGTFTWFAGQIPVRSRFAVAEPGRLLTWSTLAVGLEAVHVYRFEAIGSQTMLTAAESMSGPQIGQVISSAQLEAQIASWLEGLKALAEAR